MLAQEMLLRCLPRPCEELQTCRESGRGHAGRCSRSEMSLSLYKVKSLKTFFTLPRAVPWLEGSVTAEGGRRGQF